MQSNYNYPNMLKQAIELSEELKMPNIEWNSKKFNSQESYAFKEIEKIIKNELHHIIDARFGLKNYLGNSCLNIAATSFAYLKALDLDVEMIYGDVNVNDFPDDEFETSPDLLKYEYENRVSEGVQDIHAWVGIGKNIIIDFALPYRLLKNNNFPQHYLFEVGTAEHYEKHLVKYKPMIIGTDFFKQTNSYDPLVDTDNFRRIFDDE
ncbi:hypothetical protein [Psychrobacter sp. DAB_AL62B]|uniref:hypothetical protein n=1 Tax=Psychrobacter sp. DAB_AL62B TaxID=1028420 RepID=UPI00238113EB|nr:hypothetical protein [Psychrobacter sp. DAB_AL62B]MDE4453766.1 hypothetical protein [Psychrobacter sp. DAB_AL62B]